MDFLLKSARSSVPGAKLFGAGPDSSVQARDSSVHARHSSVQPPYNRVTLRCNRLTLRYAGSQLTAQRSAGTWVLDDACR